MASTRYPWSVPQDHGLFDAGQFVVENLAANPSGGGLVTGRLWLHTGSGEYRFYDGTTIRTVGTAGAYTDEQAQDAVGAALTDSATVDFTYNDAGPSISADVLDSPTVAGATPAQLRDTDTHTNGTTNKVYTATEKTKLAGIATGATANSSDATLLARANHTGTQLAATVSDLAATVQAYSLSTFAVPTTDLAIGTHKLTGVSDGTAASDAATFGQVNAILQGQTWKDPVRLMTQSNDTLSGLAARDGITPASGDRVLVPNQTAHADDGIYLAAAGAWSRATDADTAAELNKATVMVQSGTASGGDIYTQTATVVTVGTTAQVWVKAGEGNTVYAADGTTITLTGSTFSITSAGVTATQLAASVAGAGLVGGAGTALAVGAGTGITVNANDVQVDAATLAAIAANTAHHPAPFTINSGQTSPYTWNHALTTRDIDVTCRYNDGDYENFGVIVERPDTANLLIRFGATTTRPVRVLPVVY